jgi:hypothetical protein
LTAGVKKSFLDSSNCQGYLQNEGKENNKLKEYEAIILKNRLKTQVQYAFI